MQHHQITLKCAMLAGVASGCLFLQSGIAAAAEQPVAAGPAPQLTEVVVTARKRDENVQSIPLAVTVQTGESLEQHQVNDLFALQRVAPSMTVQSSQGTRGAPNLSIRGIGTTISRPQVESSVGLVVDDVPLARTSMANLEFYDINNVQVLRGPQGMLFGKNAAAGLVNILTNDPGLGRKDFSVHAEYGNMNSPTDGNRVHTDVMGNIPLAEN